MNVLVPHTEFYTSVACLSNAHLRQQIVDCERILAVLRGGHGLPGDWSSDPTVYMWSESQSALAVYHVMACAEWRARGGEFRATAYHPETFRRQPGWWRRQDLAEDGRDASLPVWWGLEDVHFSHRRALMSRDPGHYRQFGWRVVPSLDYVYPGINDLI